VIAFYGQFWGNSINRQNFWSPFFLGKNWITHWAIFSQTHLVALQGDQIGRIFAHWVIINFGQFYQNDKSGHNFGLLLSPVMIVH
jgi:hypothetical protein